MRIKNGPKNNLSNWISFRAGLVRCLLITSLCVGLPALAAPKQDKLDKVIAIVDDDVVLESELNERIAVIMSRLKGQYSQLPEESVMRKQVLDQLILERIELQTADKYEIKVEDDELNGAIERLMQSKDMNSERFLADLKEQGLNMAGLRRQIEGEIKINRLQQGVVNNRIKISPQEVDNFLASNDGKYATSSDYHIGHILISVPSGSSAEVVAAAEQKIKNIHEQLKNGADFAQLAIANSNDQAALKGGDIGWRKLAELPELFVGPIEKLNAGEVSEPIRSGAGFHLLKVIDKKGAQEAVIEQTHARHILIKTSEIMDDSQVREKLLSLKERIEKGEDFAKLAKQYSEDTGSKLSGGDLGWATPGTFVAAFEQAMTETPEGKICRPFKSQFGWHILQVIERKKEDMSEQMKRNQAMNLLRSRRFEEEFQMWLAQIRSDAYVEIKDGSETTAKASDAKEGKSSDKKSKKKKKKSN